MKNLRLLLVLSALTMACRGGGPVTHTGVGTKVGEQTQTTRKETSKSTRNFTEQEGKETGGSSIVKKKPENKDVAQQPEREPEKLPASQGKKSELMSRLEGVRPATPEEVAVEEGLMEEITGLIIEETMTKIGYD